MPLLNTNLLSYFTVNHDLLTLKNLKSVKNYLNLNQITIMFKANRILILLIFIAILGFLAVFIYLKIILNQPITEQEGLPSGPDVITYLT